MTAHIETAELHGQPVLKLQTPDGAVALISLFGAQVLSWVPAGGEDRLYLSPDAVFDGATPIRGGVPLCFPQFAGRGPLPKHGFARTRLWEVSNTRAGKDFALATLRLADDEASRALWPHAFSAEMSVSISGDRLDLELEVDNTGSTPFSFTAALHTYLKVREGGRIVSVAAIIAVAVNTEGKRLGFFARTRSSSQGNSIPNTSRYRKSSADSAWVCVAALTLRSTASTPRNASTSTLPMSRGCRLS